MSRAPRDVLASKQKEMLIVMTALSFIEQHALMTGSQLSDAKRSLQALFIRSTGEETMLRKLIEILRVNKDLHQAFSAISKISASIATSVEVISQKVNYLRHYIGRLQLTPDENREFFQPFLAFTHGFQENLIQFNRFMSTYLELREAEALRTHEFRIAQEASDRLRKRLSGELGTVAGGIVEQSLRNEVIETFDYQGAQEKLREAQRESRALANRIGSLLMDLRDMCQLAMNPDMRDNADTSKQRPQKYDDIFVRFTKAMKRYPRLEQIKEFIIEYFRLYQRAYGMFVLDFNNFNRAVETIAGNPEEYFDAKQEDEDIRSKREKLRRYEGLIPFLEQASIAVARYSHESFTRFSRRVSELISTAAAPWAHIGEDLLVAKVAAEAELTTRLREE